MPRATKLTITYLGGRGLGCNATITLTDGNQEFLSQITGHIVGSAYSRYFDQTGLRIVAIDSDGPLKMTIEEVDR